jgi:hypothetical protein
MSANNHGGYRRKILRITHCRSEDASKIEHVMRDDILHTVALDWLSPSEFHAAALETGSLLDTNRVDYEEYFAADEMKAATAANT